MHGINMDDGCHTMIPSHACRCGSTDEAQQRHHTMQTQPMHGINMDDGCHTMIPSHACRCGSMTTFCHCNTPNRAHKLKNRAS